MLGRLARDLPGFLRTQITVQEAAEAIRGRLVARTERFFRVAERQIYGHPSSPYAKLLHAVGCDLGDLRELVGRAGLEGALTHLASLGVYVTYDEFKGRRDIVRGSVRFRASEPDFDNPLLRPHYYLRTGGTRGTPSRVKRELATLVDMATTTSVLFDAHGVNPSRHVFWSVTPLSWFIIYAKIGQPPGIWFHPLRPLPMAVRLGAGYFKALGRLGGHVFPTPRFLDLREPARLAAWLAARARRGESTCLYTYPSSAVRVATAATDAGLSLAGVHFLTDGEPITQARRRHIEASGARAIVRYASMEIPTLSVGCADPQASDDVHILTDQLVCTQRTRELSAGGPSVDALMFSSLSPWAPKTLLNTETGDQARIERRDCGCKIGALGLRDHLLEIRSFEKLTGEGMTFAKTNLLHVLEEALPTRFGGTSLDYQLVEKETDGITRLLLLVHPRIGAIDEIAARTCLLDELARDGSVEQYMADFWRRAGTVEIRRRGPIPTGAGKILPFHLVTDEAVNLARS